VLHYELQPQSQLLFLAITLADLPQSTAFTFLQQLRTRYDHTPHEARTRRNTPA
jgi:hypothetical protein